MEKNKSDTSWKEALETAIPRNATSRDGTPFEKSFGADEGIYLKKISKSLCEEYEAIWLESDDKPNKAKTVQMDTRTES